MHIDPQSKQPARAASKDAPVAVVLGLELNGLGLTRALSRRGVRCWAITGEDWTPLHATRSVRRVIRAKAWTRDTVVETLISAGKKLEQRGVLLLTKDESVLWVSSLREELGKYYRFALPEPEVVDLLMNKARFLARAQAEGWPVPRGFLWDNEDELKRILPEVPFPSILKPQLRNSEYRKQGIPKAYKVTNGEELLAIYRRISQWEKEAILSEWIEGKDNALYSCRGFWDRDGRPVVQHAARKLMQWPIEAGNMAALEIPQVEDWSEPLAIANRVFSSVRMFGVGAVEFKRHRDGRFLILEPCVSRTVYSHEIGPLNGFDVPWAAYQYLASDGATRETQPMPSAGSLRLIDLPRAERARAEYLRVDHFSEREIDAVFARPFVDMAHRPEDPLPTLLARGWKIWRKARRVFGAR